MKETLYFSVDQNVEVTEEEIWLGKIAALWCRDKTSLSKAMACRLGKMPGGKESFQVFSAVDVIRALQTADPNIEVTNLGPPDFVVHYHGKKKPGTWWEILKTAMICLIVFFGASFAIMTFNNDVSVQPVFEEIYLLMTGRPPEGFTILELMYSVGLTAGILIFYNHFRRKKVLKDPTPLEVQMRLYEQDVNTAVIENNSRGKEQRGEDGR